MRTLKLTITGILISLFLLAQAQVSVNVTAGKPPLWGPAGYPTVRYYYLPDVESYYDVNNSTFIYYNNGTWIHRRYLPVQYRNYDLYGGYKVIMTDYRGSTPYIYYKEHKSKYAKGYHGQYQKTIGTKPGHNKIKSKENTNNNTKEGNGNNHHEGNNGHDNSNKKSHKSK